MLAPPEKETAAGTSRGGAGVLAVKSAQKLNSRPSPNPQVPSKTLLSAEEERDLVDRAHAGDLRARDRLVLAHDLLAVSMARKYASRLSAEDLAQQARIGLLKAADRFDPDRGARFSTYARWAIFAELQDYARKALPAVSLDGAFEIDEIEADPADQEAVLIEAGEIGHLRDRLVIIMDELDDRSRRIFQARRLSDDPPPLRELAAEFGISSERVRQIEVAATKKVEIAAAKPAMPVGRKQKKLRLAMAEFYSTSSPRHGALDRWVDAADKRFPEANQSDRIEAHRVADKLRAEAGLTPAANASLRRRMAAKMLGAVR